MHYKQQAERDGYMFILSGIHTTARRSILQQSVMHALDVDRSFLTLKVLLYSSVLILLAASISFTPADVFFFCSVNRRSYIYCCSSTLRIELFVLY